MPDTFRRSKRTGSKHLLHFLLLLCLFLCTYTPSLGSGATLSPLKAVTNVPEEKLSFREAIVLYRARWQIELLFKRWKSIGLIATLTGKNDAAIMVRLWARLCASVIQHWLTVYCSWRPDLLISFA